MPKEWMATLFIGGLLLLTAGVAIPTAWFLARALRRRWPPAARSARVLAPLAIVGPIVSIACAVLAPRFFPVLSAGMFGCRWTFLLLVLTWPAGSAEPTPEPWLLRLWILGCLFLSGFGVVLGFGIGVSQGVH